jgi:hypothetical protein
MDKITQALEWAQKRLELWDPLTINQIEILHFAFHELKQLQQYSVMQAEGSDVSEGAAVASSAVGSQTSAWQCPNCRCYTTNENYEKYCSQSCFDGA